MWCTYILCIAGIFLNGTVGCPPKNCLHPTKNTLHSQESLQTGSSHKSEPYSQNYCPPPSPKKKQNV